MKINGFFVENLFLSQHMELLELPLALCRVGKAPAHPATLVESGDTAPPQATPATRTSCFMQGIHLDTVCNLCASSFVVSLIQQMPTWASSKVYIGPRTLS